MHLEGGAIFVYRLFLETLFFLFLDCEEWRKHCPLVGFIFSRCNILICSQM